MNEAPPIRCVDIDLNNLALDSSPSGVVSILGVVIELGNVVIKAIQRNSLLNSGVPRRTHVVMILPLKRRIFIGRKFQNNAALPLRGNFTFRGDWRAIAASVQQVSWEYLLSGGDPLDSQRTACRIQHIDTPDSRYGSSRFFGNGAATVGTLHSIFPII